MMRRQRRLNWISRTTLLSEFGVVSPECAAALARNVKRKFGSDIGIGLTGAAGPDPHDGKPMGTVWIGIAYRDEDVKTYKLDLIRFKEC